LMAWGEKNNSEGVNAPELGAGCLHTRNIRFIAREGRYKGDR